MTVTTGYPRLRGGFPPVASGYDSYGGYGAATGSRVTGGRAARRYLPTYLITYLKVTGVTVSKRLVTGHVTGPVTVSNRAQPQLLGGSNAAMPYASFLKYGRLRKRSTEQ